MPAAVLTNRDLELCLVPRNDGCVLPIAPDAVVLGKSGSLGHGIIQRKADQVMEQFAAAMRRALEPDA